MKKLGIIGGLGPASTIEYYKLIIEQFQKKIPTTHYPEIILHSVNMTEFLAILGTNELDKVVEFLKDRVKVLEDAGAAYAVLASNTPHAVFDELAAAVNIPLISIVEETCSWIAKSGINKVGLLGTKSTMSRGFYQQTGLKFGLDISTPTDELQAYINEKYFGELVFNNIIPATKQRFLEIVEQLKRAQAIEGIILGGTELPLLLSQADFRELQVFDTTQIHVNSIVEKMLE